MHFWFVIVKRTSQVARNCCMCVCVCEQFPHFHGFGKCDPYGVGRVAVPQTTQEMQFINLNFRLCGIRMAMTAGRL